MKTISAIYEGGVFRPTEPVDLPERCPVRVEPVPENASDSVAAVNSAEQRPTDLGPFRGILKNSPVDPLEFQRDIRGEWD